MNASAQLIPGMDKIIEHIKLQNDRIINLEQENRKLKNKQDEDAMKWKNLTIDSLEKENKKLEEENLELEKQNNTRKHIIYNLFSQMMESHADIDDGLSISKEYGDKYIDEWNKIHKEIFEDVVKTMNNCELYDDNIHLEYNGDTHFDFCVDESDEEDED